ncbi:MAG: transketolase [Oscillospiraceae bacterium]
MDKKTKLNLEKQAVEVRKSIVTAVHSAKSGHPGGSLSIADTLTYLYFYKMNVDAKNPKDENRDRFVLSKGHTAPALYSVLAAKGYFPKEELLSLRKVGAMLQGHPDMKGTPGIDMSTGSLGQGISAAVGMALGGKISGAKYTVYTFLGDGEIQEGQVWEAAMSAAHYKLDNLVAVIDNNNLQIDGEVSKVMSVYPIDEKFAAFGWNVALCDAHNFDSIDAAFEKTNEKNGKPWVIIQKSIKGKGVSFMENNAAWHGTAPNDEQYALAMADLDKIEKELEGK